MTKIQPDLLRTVANTIRGLAMDAVQKADSGHPGMPMGMADAASVLWLEYLRWIPDEPHWPGRDRFVLSAGHGSMLLYALLHLSGYDLPMSELKRFRQLHSKTPGHPEHFLTPGVETTTGPLGQGFGNGVGMALGARMEAARFGCPELENRVFGIVSDGDLMEGISSEAGSLAGHLGLANLVYLYDDNHITIDGKTEIAFSEDIGKRFSSYGWRVEHADGHDTDQVRRALDAGVAESERPTLIVCRTHIGFGSPNKADTSSAHGSPLGADEVRLAKERLGLPQEEFYVPDEVRDVFAARAEAHRAEREPWQQRLEQWRRSDARRAAEHEAFRERRVPDDILAQLMEVAGKGGKATRSISGKVIQRAAALVPSLVGGSADLDSSTKTRIEDSEAVRKGDYAGRNLHFGVREHAMAAMLNGLSLHHGFLPIGSTFLTFSDYMRPSVRLAALMGVPVTFVYTHDSLLLGEDGPTHQPIEHLAALRLIPNLHVVRPADGPEVAAAWTHALRRRDGPVAMALTRQNVPALERAPDFDPDLLLRGGYVLRDAAEPAAVLLATGAEVHVAVQAAEELARRGRDLRVVSVPCLEVFLEQDEAYRDRVIPAAVPVFALEMGRPEIWCQLTGDLRHVIGISRFGASAPADDLAEFFGFTPNAVADHIETVLAGERRR